MPATARLRLKSGLDKNRTMSTTETQDALITRNPDKPQECNPPRIVLTADGSTVKFTFPGVADARIEFKDDTPFEPVTERLIPIGNGVTKTLRKDAPDGEYPYVVSWATSGHGTSTVEVKRSTGTEKAAEDQAPTTGRSDAQ